jgi:hypothetical protein
LIEDNDLLLKGFRTVTTLRELYAVLVLPDTTELTITSEFADRYFTPSGLSAFADGAKLVNPKLTVRLEDGKIDFLTRAVRKISTLNSAEEIMDVLLADPQKFIGTLQTLCKSYQSAYSETLLANNKISTLQLRLSEKQAETAALREDRENLTKLKNELAAKLDILVSRVNSAYGKSVSKETLLELKSHSYAKIMYLKEITRVRYVDTLTFYLQEILKLTYGVPARFAAIEPFYAADRARLYPRCAPSFSLTYNDVHKADIFMPGFQPKLFEDVLRNSSNVEYLIILDRDGLPEPHLSAPNVEYLFTATETGEVPPEIPRDRVISYDPDGLHIPHIKGFSELNNEERLREYSSFPVVKTIVGLMEKGR